MPRKPEKNDSLVDLENSTAMEDNVVRTANLDPVDVPAERAPTPSNHRSKIGNNKTPGGGGARNTRMAILRASGGDKIKSPLFKGLLGTSRTEAEGGIGTYLIASTNDYFQWKQLHNALIATQSLPYKKQLAIEVPLGIIQLADY